MIEHLTRAALLNKVVLAIQDSINDTKEVKESDRFVEDLQFDSLRVATLTFFIEERLGYPVMLTDWLASVQNTSELTVRSLIDFLSVTLADKIAIQAG